MLSALLGFTGCSSIGPQSLPFPDAIRTKTYTTAEFHEALIAEKKAFLADLRRYLDGDREAAFAVQLRQFPTITEWEPLRRVLKKGDEVWEFRDKEAARYKNDVPEKLRHVFWFVRDGKIIKTINVPLTSISENI